MDKNKIVFCVALIALAVSIVFLANRVASSADEEEIRTGNMQTITGTVKWIDQVERTLTLSYIDPGTGEKASVTFQVSGDAVFSRDTEGIQFSDVGIEDTVEAGYVGDIMHKPILRTLNDMNMANE